MLLETILFYIAGSCGIIYATIVIGAVAPVFQVLFLKRYARKHRILGLSLLCWLLLGIALLLSKQQQQSLIWYDIILGILGVATAASAASEFSIGHDKVKNIASGVLDENAIVTVSEMKEHVFYQLLNLAQISYIHCLSSFFLHIYQRILLFLGITCIWLLRKYFPVNSFKENYNNGQNIWSLTSLMYRTKKYQYLLYKHGLLHALNFTIALLPSTPTHQTTDESESLPLQLHFRLYWLCLNASYVMEFFLQSLVRAKYMKHSTMMLLQKILMLASTIAAMQVLWYNVYIPMGLLSFALNLGHRGHDVVNVAIASVLAFVLHQYYSN